MQAGKVRCTLEMMSKSKAARDNDGQMISLLQAVRRERLSQESMGLVGQEQKAVLAKNSSI